MTGFEVLLVPIIAWIYWRDMQVKDERDRLRAERRAQGPRGKP